ncbi:hypothetical protein [Desulfosporosinus sp.]|uniref:hypothetical protein n=1 Tax=Desulfosporosinus sp. TaxID=157907 RepID=UPI0025C64460|nr:hypothetical protein [Desulfosporosinus sp.]MBC2724657.1 hypothetical protein [Desulfosporosinus sp.]MBC2726980.1 hypothetical protein [Desulfosporosinus sp.]
MAKLACDRLKSGSDYKSLATLHLGVFLLKHNIMAMILVNLWDEEVSWSNNEDHYEIGVGSTNDGDFSLQEIDFSSLDDQIMNDPLKMLEYIKGLD